MYIWPYLSATNNIYDLKNIIEMWKNALNSSSLSDLPG